MGYRLELILKNNFIKSTEHNWLWNDVTGTKLKDRVHSSKVRDLTGTKNIKYIIKKRKHAGHIKRNKEDRWERRVLKWTPYGTREKRTDQKGGRRKL